MPAPPNKTRPAPRNGSQQAALRQGASPANGHMRSRTVWLFDRLARWLALVLVLVVTVLLVVPSLKPLSTAYRLGDVPAEHITANVSFTMLDEKRKAELEREARENALALYRLDRSAAEDATRRVEALLRQGAEIVREHPDAKPADHAAMLQQWARDRQDAPISPQTAAAVLKHAASADETRQLQEAFAAAVQTLYEATAVVDNIERYRNFDVNDLVRILETGEVGPRHRDVLSKEEVIRFLRDRFFADKTLAQSTPASTRNLVMQLAEAYTRPNLLWEPERSRDALYAQIEKIQPVLTFDKGFVVAPKGEKIDRDRLAILAQMDRAYAQTFYKRLIAIVFYVVLLCMLVFYYIRLFRPDISFETRNVFLVALPVLLALFVGRVGLLVFESEHAAGYAFPAGMIGMLAVILFDVRTAVLLVTVGNLAFSVPTGMDFEAFVTGLLGGYAAVTVLTSVQERKEVLKAGLVVGIVNGAVILLVNLMGDPNELDPQLILWGIGNGLLCSVFAMPALALFESMLGVVTDIRLLELTGLGHPLLERLEREAPGSYQHSLNVMKLSEAAAKAIGANFLLVRAGSLYHDIGKVVKPKYFGENQMSLEEKSLHGKISPYMSAMVIKNHVKAGIEIARKHKLPQRIVDFIPQHHGTTIISFFYHEALKRFENSESTDPVRESDFRYPGPKPQSIETAIVMLADSVEATVTSRFAALSVNEDELYLVVQNSVLSKFNDGQFDQCDLTFRDLEEIRRSFVRTLLSRFHHRVAYPTTPALSGAAAPGARRDRMERDPQPALARAEK